MANFKLLSKNRKLYFVVAVVCLVSICVWADDKEPSKPPAEERWKKKDVRDYTDADVERLYDQWEEAEEEQLEEDELPEWKRPQPQIDLSKLNVNDPEAMLGMTKKGRTLMMFATVSGNPTEKETERITTLWQTSLFNAHYDLQRYVVGENRILLTLKDGSKAWEVKDFLVTQERCELVTIEGKDYPGAGSTKGKKASDEKSKKSDKTSESKKKKKTKADNTENETRKKSDKVEL